MSASKLQRTVLVAELVAAAALCLWWRSALPVLIPLFVAATFGMWFRGRSWSDAGLVWGADSMRSSLVGLASGAVAATVIALVGGADVLPSLTAIPPGVMNLIMSVVLLVAMAAASELAFRGYVITRVVEQFGQRWQWVGVVVGALLPALAALSIGWVAAVGAFVAGLGFGLLYTGAQRKIMLPLCAHASFDASLALIALWFV